VLRRKPKKGKTRKSHAIKAGSPRDAILYLDISSQKSKVGTLETKLPQLIRRKYRIQHDLRQGDGPTGSIF